MYQIEIKNNNINRKEGVALLRRASPCGSLRLNIMTELDKISEMYKTWRDAPDDTNTSNLLGALKPQINSALKNFAPGMEDSLSLKANVLAMKALKTYDPTKGMHIKSYVYQQLQPIQRVFGKRSNPVKVPERQILEGSALSRYENEFRDEWGREPSVAELADIAGVSIKRIEKIRRNKVTVSETGSLNEETGDTMSSNKDDPQEVWAHYIYAGLDPVDQRIYEMVTGYGGSKTFKKTDIAAHLKISPAAVSQRVNKIVAKLQEGINLG